MAATVIVTTSSMPLKNPTHNGAILTVIFLLIGLLVISVSATRRKAPRTAPLNRQPTIETVTVDSGRPVADAIRELEKKYGWLITYEDPVYLNTGEIADVTNEVRRDLDQYKPGEAPKVYVPKAGPLTISFAIDPQSGKPEKSPEALVQQILEANEAAGYAGKFYVERDEYMLHVIPTAYKDKAGQLVPLRSILDSTVTIGSQERTAEQSLDLLCSSVNSAGRGKVLVGMHDPNLFLQVRSNISARRETATVFLVRLLQTLNKNADLSWQLFYDPTMRNYFLNFHQVLR